MQKFILANFSQDLTYDPKQTAGPYLSIPVFKVLHNICV